jgi:hypothetical protein
MTMLGIKRKSLLIGILGALYVFLLGPSLQVLPMKFVSPDETANAFFSSLVTQHSRLSATQYDELDLHPRSVGVLNHELVPTSFLGLPVYYGFIGKLVGTSAVSWVIALLTVTGLFCYFKVLRQFFSERTSQIATLLLAVQPAFLFYAMRPYWHNGPFIALVFIAAYLASRALRSPSIFSYATAGTGLGLALAFRAVEILWLAPLLIVLGILVRQRIKVSFLPVFFAGTILALLPVLYFQMKTFGQPLLGAYAESRTVLDGPVEVEAVSLFVQLFRYVIPWGLHPVEALMNFWQFAFGMMFPAAALGFIGLFMANRRQRPYALLSLGVTVWLLLYYGSFNFVEYVFDPGANLLGSSYLRYWLPVFAALLPFAVLALRKTASFLAPSRARYFSLVLFSGIALSSLSIVVADPNYGVVVTKTKLSAEYQEKSAGVLSVVPENGLIFAGPDDKIYWPQRSVIGFGYGPMPDHLVRELYRLAENPHVYYVTEIPGEITRVNKRLDQLGLEWEERRVIRGPYTLYQLVKKPEKSVS